MAVPSQSHPQPMTHRFSLLFPQLPVSLSGTSVRTALGLTISATPRGLSSWHLQAICPVFADLPCLTPALHTEETTYAGSHPFLVHC